MVFGAIDIETGKFYYQINKKRVGDNFLYYLRYLVKKFKGEKSFLVLDNGRIHKSKKVSEYLLRNKDKIELHFLPPYSPKLNPIEKLWKSIKQNNMHVRFFENKKVFLESLEKALMIMESNVEQVLSLMSKWVFIFNLVKNELSLKNENWNRICSCIDKAFA